jgi:hypothetical protein
MAIEDAVCTAFPVADRAPLKGWRGSAVYNQLPDTGVNQDAWGIWRAHELEEPPRCLSYHLA